MSHYFSLYFVAALALLLSGCGPSAESRLQGKWEMDMSKTDIGKKIDEAAASQGNPLGGIMAGALKDMGKNVKIQFEFKPQGQLAMQGSIIGFSHSNSGKWRVIKASSNDVTIAGKMDGESKEWETKITFIDNDTIEMIPPAGDQKDPATFHRVKVVK